GLNTLFNDSLLAPGCFVTVFNTITDDVTVNAKVSVVRQIALIYEATVAINFSNMDFDNPGNEERQTIIHEMMHVIEATDGVGIYQHPDRCDEISDRCDRVDKPLDGGPYYNSPPLRAELCIAGNQSIGENQSLEKVCCSFWKGSWIAWKDPQSRVETISKEYYKGKNGLNRLLKVEDIL
ncbi:MAG: hypothetical protein ACK5Z3_09035, partial [Pseudanabaena sp.]